MTDEELDGLGKAIKAGLLHTNTAAIERLHAEAIRARAEAAALRAARMCDTRAAEIRARLEEARAKFDGATFGVAPEYAQRIEDLAALLADRAHLIALVGDRIEDSDLAREAGRREREKCQRLMMERAAYLRQQAKTAAAEVREGLRHQQDDTARFLNNSADELTLLATVTLEEVP